MPGVLRPRASLGERGADRVPGRRGDAARVAIRASLNAAADALISILLAPACAACRGALAFPAAGPVCGACWSAVRTVAAPTCRRCGDPLPSWRVESLAAALCARCRRVPSSIDRGAAALEYEGALREIVHAFKYEGRLTLAPRLAAWMRDAGREVLAGADAVVPVPMHPWRRLRRGSNHARVLAGHLDAPLLDALWRPIAAPPQAGLSAAQRRRNLRRVIALSPCLALRRQRVEGLVLVLVDDVRTTGATLEACARVLKGAGAKEVRALTLARAAPPRR